MKCKEKAKIVHLAVHAYLSADQLKVIWEQKVTANIFFQSPYCHCWDGIFLKHMQSASCYLISGVFFTILQRKVALPVPGFIWPVQTENNTHTQKYSQKFFELTEQAQSR